MEVWIIWMIVAVGLLITEVLTQMMWALCLTAGAAVAMVFALAGMEFEWQVGALVLVSVLVYVCFLPVFRRWHMKRDSRRARTGMDALLGRRGMVTHEIRPGMLGRVRIDGDSWQVKAPEAEDTVPRGTEVVVTAYDSIILTVRQLEDN